MDMGLKGVIASAMFPILGAGVGAWRVYAGFKKVRDEDVDIRRIKPRLMILCVFMAMPVFYGLIGALIINGIITETTCNTSLAAGLIIGLTCAAVAIGTGFFGERAIPAVAKQPRLFVGMVLILIFVEALALYALIAGLVTLSGGGQGKGKHLPQLMRTADMSFGYACKDVFSFVLSACGAVFASCMNGAATMEIGVENPRLVMRFMMPVSMAGVYGIYALITAVIPNACSYVLGLCCLTAGIAMGIFTSSDIKTAGAPDAPRNLYTKMLIKALAISSFAFFGLVCALVQASVANAEQGDTGYGSFAPSSVHAPAQLVDQGPFPSEVSPAAIVLLSSCVLVVAAVVALRRRRQAEPLAESLL